MRTAGVDEAGVGALFGDMVAAAVVMPTHIDVADSKRTSAKRRKVMYDQIMAQAEVGVGRVTSEEIDTLGMAHCRRLVLTRAVDALAETHGAPQHIIVDGTLFTPWRDVPYECIPRADATVPCVSAASIVAKVTRDEWVAHMCTQHDLAPYGMPGNAGYPTAAHKAAIQNHGSTPWHRKSFRGGTQNAFAP